VVALLVEALDHQADVGVQPRLDDQLPDLLLEHRQLGRVERLDLVVLVDQPRQLVQPTIGVGGGHRRRQVIDDDGVGAALGLGALARVVDDERVHQREVVKEQVGVAGL
jgi:hypothetical protein